MSLSKTPAQLPAGNTPIDLSTSTLSPEPATKHSKTRKPPSVRTKKLTGKENKLPDYVLLPHTPPRVSTITRPTRPERDGLQLIVDDFQSAIHAQDWEELGNLIDHYSNRGLHFELNDNKDHSAVKKMREESVLQVLTANRYVSDEQMNAALDLLSMGADWNAKDKNGTSVLNILRKNMTDEVLTLITDEYPSLKRLFIDKDGRLIAPTS